MSPDERWLAASWPFVRAWLPAAPARVAEVGCGPLGGFVPMMQAAGYQATGIDPQAPPGPSYRQALFEDYAVPGPLDAIVACTSLHHVASLGAALDLLAQALVPAGRVVAVEWARERFDEETARWCFARLSDDDPGWLGRRQAEWRESGQRWDDFLRSWADAEGLHAGQDILDALDARFDRQAIAWGPYFFPDLAGISDADEQAAIDSGLIRPNRIQYAGQRRSHPGPGGVPGNLLPAEIRIRPGASSRVRVARRIGERDVDPRYRWCHPLRAGGVVDRSRVGRGTGLGHVGSLTVRAARRGGGYCRAGAPGLGGRDPASAH